MRTILVIAGAIVLVAGGCARVYNPAIRHGAIYSRNSHNLKLPPLAVRTSAVGFVGLQGRPSLRGAVAVGRVGLQFSDSGRIAQLAVRTHLKGAVDTTVTDTLSVSNRDFRPSYHYGIRLHTPPGRYNIHVQITDLANDTHTKQKVRAAVPAPTTTGIGSVRASAKDSAGWHPLAGYNVAGHIDSLRFTLQVAPDSTATMILHAYLVRFTADTTISYPNSPFTSHPRMRWAFTVYPKISLIYRGIDYTDSTVLHADRRRLRGAGPVQIRFQFQAPPRGNYRFEVQTHRQLKARDFAVRSPDFPAVRTPRERAATLAYLMRGPNQKPYLLIKKRLGNINSVSLDKVLKRLLIDKKQDLHDDKNSYAKLIAIKDPDSLRAAVHRFWQVHMDSATARKVAAKYYRRVRQANRLFSNYKEGWKTDRGHLYILYGKPYNVHFVSWWQGTPGKMQLAWPYGNCAGIGGWAYSLMRPREKSAAFPFEHFMLRSGELFNSALPTKKQQQLWLSGNILNTLFWDHEINAPCYE